MVARRGKPVVARSKAPAARRGRPAKAASNTHKAATKASPAKARGRQKTDLTEYATKPATDYHKAFARWGVQECGVDLDSMSAKAAYLKGIQIASAARPRFMESEFLAEWRESGAGGAKRGPKPATEKSATRTKAKSRPVEDDDEDFDDDDVVDDEDDFEDSDEDFNDDDSDEDESDDDDDDFEDDDDESEEDDDEDESDEDDEDDFEDEPVKPARRRAPAKRVAAKASSKTRGSSAPRGRARAKATEDDSEDLF